MQKKTNFHDIMSSFVAVSHHSTCNDVAGNERGLPRFYHFALGGEYLSPHHRVIIVQRCEYAITFFLSCVSLLWKIRGHIAVLPYCCLADGVLIQGDSANLCGALAWDRSEVARRRDAIHAFI